MDERGLRGLLDQVKAGRMSRRAFVRRMAAAGLTAPMATQLLAFSGVAMAQSRPVYKPTSRGGGGLLKVLWWQGPTLLNPHFATGTKDQDGSRLFYEPLAGWDAEGNLRFHGRKKNVIVTPAGLNIYPEDLETKLREYRQVRDCVVVGMRSGSDMEPCAVILPQTMDDNSPRAAAQIEEECAYAVTHANRFLAEYQRIRKWVIWPEADFPRTSTGKPRYAQISARLPELLEPGKNAAPARDFFKSLGFSFSHGEKLEELSSLDRVELLSAVEQRYNVELNETAFAEARTVEDVQRLLLQPAAKRGEFHYPRWTQWEFVRWFRL